MTRVRAIAAVVVALALSAGFVSAQVPQASETFEAAWTIIRDTHFDKTMNGLNWEAVRAELKPRAAVATSSYMPPVPTTR